MRDYCTYANIWLGQRRVSLNVNQKIKIINNENHTLLDLDPESLRNRNMLLPELGGQAQQPREAAGAYHDKSWRELQTHCGFGEEAHE